MPWWVLIWLKRSPLVFLVLSVSCFSIGLVFFSYSSRQVFFFYYISCYSSSAYSVRLQHYVVSTITTVFTAFSSFGLIAVSLWFIFERWVFIRHRGSKWLRDSLDDCWIVIAEIFSRRQLLSAMGRANDALTRAKAFLFELARPRPTTEIIPPSDSWSSLTHAPSSTMRTSQYHPSGSLRTCSPSPMATPPNPDALLPSHNIPEEVMTSGAAQTTAMPVRRARFVQAIRSVIIAQQGPTGIPRALPSIFSPEGLRQEELRGLIRSSRVARLAPMLRDFKPTQEFAAHQALVRHLQFSPNGKFLATSRLVFSFGSPWSLSLTQMHLSPKLG